MAKLQSAITNTSDLDLGCKNDFPVLLYNKDLVYLDSAASAQKPKFVLDSMYEYASQSYANIHRGVYKLSEQSSEAFENSRLKVSNWLGTKKENIVFTTNATMSFNLVAQRYLQNLDSKKAVLVTQAEHHSNYLPWQQECLKTNRRFLVSPLLDDGRVDLYAFEKLLQQDVGFVSIYHVSNVTGHEANIKKVIGLAHRYGAVILIDGCQAQSHMRVNVKELDCDFYVFTGHKVYGPSGIGVLFGKEECLDVMEPLLYGGGMVGKVDVLSSDWTTAPGKFEAGTPPIVEAIGLGYAIDYLSKIGMDSIYRHSIELGKYLHQQLSIIEGVDNYSVVNSPIQSFILKGVHPHDMATILDSHNIAIRAGNHCAQPLMKKLGVVGTVRASIGIYNTKQDIDKLCKSILNAKSFFKV